MKTSGVSDYKNLLNRALDKLKEVIDKIWPEGKFDLLLDPDDERGVKITVYLKETNEGSFVKRLQKNYKMVVDTAYDEDKVDVYRSLAHEITHISQKMNGFSDYEFKNTFKEWKKFRERRPKKDMDLFRDMMHDKKLTEHEAKLVGLLILLRNGHIKEAVDELKTEPEYYKNYDWKQFVKKAISLNVSVEAIREFQTAMKKYIDDIFLKTEAIPAEDLDGDIFNYYFGQFVDFIKMLNLDAKYYETKIKNLFSKVPEINKTRGSWNWPYLEKLVKKLGKINVVDTILKELRWIKSFDVSKELTVIENTDTEFMNKLKALLNTKFTEIGRILKTILRPASKGVRKGLLIFVPDAARKIDQIDDEFVRFIIRDIYDNFKDMTSGILWRIHFNQLFSTDFVFEVMKELNEKIRIMEQKKKELKEFYLEQWSKLHEEGRNYERFYAKESDNVFNPIKPISKPYYEKANAFKAKVKQEHPRVPDDKIYRFIQNDYRLRQDYEKIKNDYLQNIPEYMDYKRRTDEHFEEERKDVKVMQDQIDEELKKLNFAEIKKAIGQMTQGFVSTVAQSIAHGKF